MTLLNFIERIFPEKKLLRLTSLSLCAILTFFTLFLGFSLPLNHELRHTQLLLRQTQNSLVQKQSVISHWNKPNRQTLTSISAKIHPLHLSQLLGQFALLSQANGFTIHSVQPLPQYVLNGLSAQPVKLEIWGNFSQLLKFLTDLSKLSFLISLGDFQLKTTTVHAQTHSITMNLILNVYSSSEHND